VLTEYSEKGNGYFLVAIYSLYDFLFIMTFRFPPLFTPKLHKRFPGRLTWIHDIEVATREKFFPRYKPQ